MQNVETKKVGEEFLDDELDKIEGSIRLKTQKMIDRVEEGERDVFS